MKKILTLLIVLLTFCTVSFAIEADDSIDDEIKSEYNTETLPNLPKTPINPFEKNSSSNESKVQITTPPKEGLSETKTSKKLEINQSAGNHSENVSKISRGTKVHAKLLTPVSDWAPEGTKVKFAVSAPFKSKKFIIQPGTIIYGTVVNSHRPSILGNGGLISVKTDYIEYNSKNSYFDGKIISKNGKAVLFNNIKGKNGYINGVKKIGSPGVKFMKKTKKVCNKMWNGPFAILTPIPYAVAGVFLVGNSVVAPFGAIFSKGQSVKLPKDTEVVLKLLSESYAEY